MAEGLRSKITKYITRLEVRVRRGRELLDKKGHVIDPVAVAQMEEQFITVTMIREELLTMLKETA